MAKVLKTEITRLESDILGALETHSPEERLESCRELATLALREIARMSGADGCEADDIGQALDSIDFALGQAFAALHER